jgi:acyl-CoA synthetase (AMP-forming)/AMP-acid ligase II
LQRSLMWPLERAAITNGTGLATICGDRRRTWAAVHDRVRGLAAGLAGLGIDRGARVAVLMLNSDRHLETWFAIPGGGFVLTDLNFRLAPEELRFTLEDSGASVLIVDDAHAALGARLVADVSTLEHLVFAGDGEVPAGAVSFEDLVATPVRDLPPIDEHDLAAIFYTGGTTGLPKGARLSHGNLLANALHTIGLMQLTEDDVYLHAAPQFHLADGALTFSLTWQAGTHVFIPGFDPAGVARLVEAEQVTLTLLVPTMITMLVSSPVATTTDWSSLRLIVYGASPMPAEVQRRAHETFGCDFTQAYGMTEVSPVATCLSAGAHRKGFAGQEPWVSRLRSAGCAIPGVQVQVRLEDGVTVAKSGEVGEVYISGPTVMQGYWERPEETAHALVEGGWYRSGDVAYADDDGYVFIVDRAKDMIISGGENVYSTEVENALFSHDGVLEAAVIGIPHAVWGEAVHAEIVPKPDAVLTEDELIAHCRGRIAGYKLPRSVSLRTEALPKSGAGKVLKRDLRAQFWGDQERNVR